MIPQQWGEWRNLEKNQTRAETSPGSWKRMDRWMIHLEVLPPWKLETLKQCLSTGRPGSWCLFTYLFIFNDGATSCSGEAVPCVPVVGTRLYLLQGERKFEQHCDLTFPSSLHPRGLKRRPKDPLWSNCACMCYWFGGIPYRPVIVIRPSHLLSFLQKTFF